MQHYEHGSRQIGRKVADDLLQRLDPAGGRADDDYVVVGAGATIRPARAADGSLAGGNGLREQSLFVIRQFSRPVQT
ncbi:hypothetical protein [Mesorhizobium sp.]|uniref:hypothetical protein n=1 Tax=Mesorhizobium sp. TaxID=1871066 RepID=UPI0025C6D358|nr:hypothetical protein [Mesorhizobium sp.]